MLKDELQQLTLTQQKTMVPRVASAHCPIFLSTLSAGISSFLHKIRRPGTATFWERQPVGRPGQSVKVIDAIRAGNLAGRLAWVVLFHLERSMITGETTGGDTDFMDLRPGAKPLPLLRGGPVISIKAETGNLATLARMQNEIDIVRDISTRLDAAQIGYMLTGSMAMNSYDLPCVPHNLDFVIALRPQDAEVMVRLFNPDYDISREGVDSAIARQSFFNLLHRKNRIKVNCILCQQTKFRLNEYSRRQHVKFENFMTWIVSKEDLIISKLHWVRKSRSPRHLRDVKNLVATGCDASYIERWTRALGVFKLWEECSQV